MTFSAWDRDSFFNGSEKAIGWLHNTSYWWGNLYNHNTIITNCVDLHSGYNVPGAPLNTSDDYDYYDRKYDEPDNEGDDDITNYTDYKFKVQGLRKFKRYEISWYYTDTGLPTFITDEDVTDVIGTAKFDIPSVLTVNYGDLGFKVKMVENKRFILSDSTTSNEAELIEETNHFNVKIFPNPAKGELNLESNEEMSRMVIYSIDGSLIMNIEISTNIKKIPINLNNGYYTVVIYNKNNEFITKKLCIIR